MRQKGTPSKRLIDITGQQFGRWTVIRRAENSCAGRQTAWLCRCECGNEKVVTGFLLRRGTSRSCGCILSEVLQERNKNLGYLTAQRNRTNIGEKHPRWKGGRWINKDGYAVLHRTLHGGKEKYRLEHVVVMERILGRPLLPDETVHHKNGVRDDNRDDNLELWVSNHPTGQRITDVVMWAKEMLRRYDKGNV